MNAELIKQYIEQHLSSADINILYDFFDINKNDHNLSVLATKIKKNYTPKIEKITADFGKKKGTMGMKRKVTIISYDMENVNCDTIDWFVDILGTLNLLSTVLNWELDKEVPVVDQGRLAIDKTKTGLYFDGSHWYCVKDNKISDSYSQKYQVKETAHFCQTFALLMYLGRTSDLKDITGKYGGFDRDLAAHNIKVAITFWEKLFKKYPGLIEYILEQLQSDPTYEDRPVNFKNRSVMLNKFTKNDLMEYMKIIKANAIKFVNCKQG